MAVVTKTNAKSLPRAMTAPYGNANHQVYTLATSATGVMVDSNQKTAIAAGDVIRLGIIQAGTTLVDSLSIVSAVFLGTAKVGFAYIDGVDDTNVPQNDSYFHAALALSAQGRTRANNLAVKPVQLYKDAYLIVTPAAAQTGAGRLDIVLENVWEGSPTL